MGLIHLVGVEDPNPHDNSHTKLIVTGVFNIHHK